MTELKKILCIKRRRLGDTAIWTAALAALRDFFPQAEIHLDFPESYRALFIDDNRYRLAPEKWRPEQYDLALNFHASPATARRTRWSGAKTKAIHFHSRRPNRAWFTLPIPSLGQPMSAIERDLNVVRAVGWSGASPHTEVRIGTATREAGADFLRSRGWRGGPLVLLSPFASRPSKQWNLPRYAELARKLAKKVQVGVVYDGKPSELAPLLRSALDLPTPELSLLLGALPHASQWIGSDSGVKHLACALGVPTLTLFGPESIGEWHGYGEPHAVLQRKVLCRSQDPEPPKFAWCGEEICPLASHACMNLLSVDDVLARLPPSLLG